MVIAHISMISICSHCCTDEEFVYEAEIQLLTGRTHQIRAQMAFEGSSVIGDEMYRDNRTFAAKELVDDWEAKGVR